MSKTGATALGWICGEAQHSSIPRALIFHEGAGACCMVIDPVEQLTAVWFVPFTDDNWYAEALFNVTNVIWSGLM
ncbi:hypothetical protein ACFSQ7_35670 [Paenibacillus rhizoplanae]